LLREALFQQAINSVSSTRILLRLLSVKVPTDHIRPGESGSHPNKVTLKSIPFSIYDIENKNFIHLQDTSTIRVTGSADNRCIGIRDLSALASIEDHEEIIPGLSIAVLKKKIANGEDISAISKHLNADNIDQFIEKYSTELGKLQAYLLIKYGAFGTSLHGQNILAKISPNENGELNVQLITRDLSDELLFCSSLKAINPFFEGSETIKNYYDSLPSESNRFRLKPENKGFSSIFYHLPKTETDTELLECMLLNFYKGYVNSLGDHLTEKGFMRNRTFRMIEKSLSTDDNRNFSFSKDDSYRQLIKTASEHYKELGHNPFAINGALKNSSPDRAIDMVALATLHTMKENFFSGLK
jgi:hypothetical protein